MSNFTDFRNAVENAYFSFNAAHGKATAVLISLIVGFVVGKFV